MWKHPALDPAGFPRHMGATINCFSDAFMSEPQSWHGTTILSVRKDGKVVVAGDGQVSLGQTVIKSNATKVRRIADGKVVVGFAGATADAFTSRPRTPARAASASVSTNAFVICAAWKR